MVGKGFVMGSITVSRYCRNIVSMTNVVTLNHYLIEIEEFIGSILKKLCFYFVSFNFIKSFNITATTRTCNTLYTLLIIKIPKYIQIENRWQQKWHIRFS